MNRLFVLLCAVVLIVAIGVQGLGPWLVVAATIWKVAFLIVQAWLILCAVVLVGMLCFLFVLALAELIDRAFR